MSERQRHSGLGLIVFGFSLGFFKHQRASLASLALGYLGGRTIY